MRFLRYATGAVILLLLGLLAACDMTTGTTATGAQQTAQVNIPLPADKGQTWDIELDTGAATVAVGPGTADLVAGTIDYNLPELKPAVTTAGQRVQVSTGNINFKTALSNNIKNDWHLTLGLGVPLNLTVNAGATQGQWELGGLSLRAVTWSQGAADATIGFSQPNPVSLDNFSFAGGASRMTLTGLANANIKAGQIQGGAGTLELHFDGTLAQNADLTLESGMAHVVIYSGGNPVQVTADSSPTAPVQSDWTASGSTYSSPEMAGANGPKVTIHATIALGSLELKSGK